MRGPRTEEEPRFGGALLVSQMVELVDSQKPTPLSGSFECPLTHRHAGGVCDPIHHLEVGYHSRGIDHAGRSELVEHDRPGRVAIRTASGEGGVDEVEQHSSCRNQRIHRTVGDSPGIKRDGGDVGARTEHLAVG